MILNRRSFLALGAAGTAMASTQTSASKPAADWKNIRALAFDAFAIFDPQPIFRACSELFPSRGVELATLWRTRQFEYQWLRALGGHYQDFWQVTRSALEFAARSLKLALSAANADSLMQGYLALKPWPDVPDALSELRRSARKLALLSNATPRILEAGIRNGHLDGLFHAVVSTDAVKTFKPDPLAYRLGTDVLALRREHIMFVAYAGWDAVGAKWFGYPTFWNNRQAAMDEELGAQPDGTGESLRDLLGFLDLRTRGST
jgi:2-haloacid dehalogenase